MTYLLEPVGMSECENAVYLTLLDRGTADADAISGQLGLVIHEVVEALARLEVVGLAHRAHFDEPRYHAISPGAGLNELIARRRADLTALQVEADRLDDELQRAAAADHPEVEVVTGTAAVMDAQVQLQRQARSEVLFIDAPPYFPGGGQPNASEHEGLAAGVAYRVIYHRQALENEQARAAMREFVDAGEVARMHAGAWPKLLVADGRLAIVPASMSDPDPERRLLLRPSTLLDLLVAHFERLWTASVAVTTATDDGSDEISDRDRDLLSMLAAGMKDRSIARVLGITERTVGRRVTELSGRLEAGTRFQLGVRATARGWVSVD